MATTNRQSGIELMRIIVIFMIMVTHATYMTFGFPQIEEILESPVKLFGYICVENITVICVNVFVLISGWFGMRPTIKNVGGLVFQCLFFGAIVQLFFHFMGIEALSLHSANAIITFLPFVNAYIVLSFLAPILNSYCEKASKTTFRNFLIVYYSWGFLMGWLLNKDEEFYIGKSVICFIGLYLLARYIRLHVKFPEKIDKAYIWGTLWTLSVLLLTFLDVSLSLNNHTTYAAQILMGFSISYISPFVIMHSLLLFLCFRKINITSKVINWIAISAFASVLLHGNMESEYYCPMIKHLYCNNPLWLFIFKALGFMCAFFVAGVFMDKIRIYIWSVIYPHIDNICKQLFKYNTGK